MAAKKNIIRQLRQEIKDLTEQMSQYRKGMVMRERQFSRIQHDHKDELDYINARTNNLASTLQYKFNKDLTWLNLCDDPESKLQHVKYVIGELKKVARPNKGEEGEEDYRG